MSYIYETHLHTSEASACGKTLGKDYIDYMRGLGYSGIIVTDHFFNGNSAVPRNMPWEQRIELYCSGYEHALAEAKKTGFTVLFGIEYNFEGDEYLIYGLEKEWLMEQTDILSLSRKEVYEAIHKAGAIMVQAHPYRERNYLKDVRLTPSICDGIEIYNAANVIWQNALAYEYAKKLHVPMSSGSDIHFFHDNAKGGMMFEQEIHSIQDYVAAFLAGKGTPVSIDNGTVTPVYEMDGMENTDRKSGVPVLYME